MRLPWLTRAVVRDLSGYQALDARVAFLAAAQHGVISREQAILVGASHKAIRTRREASRWLELFPGVFAVGHAEATSRGRAIAALLVCPRGSALSHATAAAIYDATKPDFAAVHLTTPFEIDRGGLVTHTSQLSSEDWRLHGGLPVTSPARTCLDCAETETPAALARSHRPRAPGQGAHHPR